MRVKIVKVIHIFRKQLQQLPVIILVSTIAANFPASLASRTPGPPIVDSGSIDEDEKQSEVDFHSPSTHSRTTRSVLTSDRKESTVHTWKKI